MIPIFFCGIVFAICVYRGSQTKNAEEKPALSSVFASASSHPFFIDTIIPTPAPADGLVCLPSLLSVYGSSVHTGLFPALNSLTHGLSGQKPNGPGIIDHSLLLHKSGRKC